MSKEKQSKFALPLIVLTVLVDMIGVGVIIPIIPELLYSFTGETSGENSLIGMLLMISFAGMQFFFAPILGEFSDKYGRRPILLMALLGLSVDYLFHALAPSLLWLFVGRFLAGITGATHSVAFAYVADISTKKNKARNFGMIGAAFGLGFVLGPLIGGYFGEENVRLPFYIAAGLAFVNFLFGLFFIPESLPKEKRRNLNLTKMIPGVALFSLKNFKGVGLLIIGLFVAYMAGQSLPATWSFYCEEMFSWGPSEIGLSLAVVGLLVAIVQAVLVGIAVKLFGSHKAVIVGFILYTIGMIGFGLASTPLLLYLALIPYTLGGIAGPTLQGIISNQVPENQQGNLQGAIASLNSLSTIFGPMTAGIIFTIFANREMSYYFPGAPYLSAGLLLILATFIVSKALQGIKETMPGEEDDLFKNEDGIIDNEMV